MIAKCFALFGLYCGLKISYSDSFPIMFCENVFVFVSAWQCLKIQHMFFFCYKPPWFYWILFMQNHFILWNASVNRVSPPALVFGQSEMFCSLCGLLIHGSLFWALNKSSACEIILPCRLVDHFEWVCNMSCGLQLTVRKYRRVFVRGGWIQENGNRDDGIQCLGDLKMIPFRSPTKADEKGQIHTTDG